MVDAGATMKAAVSLVFFGGFILASATIRPVYTASTRSPYIRKDLAKFCPGSGSKREVRLGTGAAVFTLRAADLRSDLFCHLELEVSSGNGMHVYIEEMNMAGNEAADDCSDYVQFARDVFAFTTYRSPKYCGHRRRIDFSKGPDDAYKSYNSKQLRHYVEETDDEMDIWLQVGRNRGTRSVPDTRNVTLVVTVFNKRCKSPTYSDTLKCPYTDHCIRRDFFCDGHVNCAWPDGDVGTDEASCDEDGKYFGPGSGKSGGGYDDIVSASNIPIIIIVIIVVIGICLVFFMALRHVYVRLKAGGRGRTDARRDSFEAAESRSGPAGNGRRRRRRRSPEESATAPPLLHEVGGGSDGERRGSGSRLRSMPSAPPPYEEAVKVVDGRPTVVVDSAFPPNPPPYSETAPTVTTAAATDESSPAATTESSSSPTSPSSEGAAETRQPPQTSND